MKPSLENFDRPETEPQQFKDHEFADNNDSQKAGSKFKRRLVLLITVAIALGAFLMTACDDEPEPVCLSCPPPNPNPTPTTPTPPTTTPADKMTIRSINPSDGAPGDVVTVVLENFTDSNTNPYVTFGSSSAEIIYARWGMIKVRVPLDLRHGSYTVTVRSNGQVASALNAFKVTQDQD